MPSISAGGEWIDWDEHAAEVDLAADLIGEAAGGVTVLIRQPNGLANGSACRGRNDPVGRCRARTNDFSCADLLRQY